MELKDNLTNEAISKRFEENFHLVNQFDLVNYSIHEAEKMIRSGRAPRIKTQTENTALIILDEILKGKDVVEEAEEEKAMRPMEDLPAKKEAPSEKEVVEENSGKEPVHSE